MNKAFIIGRLVRDPEFRMTPSGIALCRFTIATDRIPKQENQCFVFGSESGFPHTFPSLNSCKIPMNQHVESLNISVSTGIILEKLFTKKFY